VRAWGDATAAESCFIQWDYPQSRSPGTYWCTDTDGTALVIWRGSYQVPSPESKARGRQGALTYKRRHVRREPVAHTHCCGQNTCDSNSDQKRKRFFWKPSHPQGLRHLQATGLVKACALDHSTLSAQRGDTLETMCCAVLGRYSQTVDCWSGVVMMLRKNRSLAAPCAGGGSRHAASRTAASRTTRAVTRDP
jgi:hypothetical protein